MYGSLHSTYSRRKHSSESLVRNSSRRFPSAALGSARTWEVQLSVQLGPVDSRVAPSLREAPAYRPPGILTSGVFIAARLRHKELNCFRKCGRSAPSA